MHPQLQAVHDDLTAAQRRLDALSAATPDDRWTLRAHPDRWSVGECVAHLNITTKAFLPDFRRALADPAFQGVPAPERYRMDFLGRMLYHVVGPVKKVFGIRLAMKVKTQASFVPLGNLPRDVTVAEFAALQRELLDVLRQSEGRPVDRMRVPSPFDTRVSYNMYSAMAIVPRHQHRHLEQAEEVWRPVAH